MIKPTTLFVLLTMSFSAAQAQAFTDAFEVDSALSATDRLFFENDLDRPYHLYTINLREHQMYEVRLESTDFDPYLQAVDENLAVYSNDDGIPGTLNSRLVLMGGGISDADANGSTTFQIRATAYRGGTYGSYKLVGRPGAIGEEIFVSRRDSMRLVSIKGQAYDSFNIAVARPGDVRIHFTGTDYPPYVTLRSESGESVEPTWSTTSLEYRLDVPGTYSLLTYTDPGIPGYVYGLTAYLFPLRGERTREQREGVLSSDDPRLPSGELYDTEEGFTIRRGETIQFQATATDYTPVLIVQIQGTDRRMLSDYSESGAVSVNVSEEIWNDADFSSREELPLRLFVTSAYPNEVGIWNVSITKTSN